MWIRSAAFSCAFACGAMVVGPGVLGTAVAHAILGIGPDLDIFDLFGDDDQKSSLHHPRPGAEDVSGQAARTVGVTTSDAGPPVSTFGSVPESAGPVGISGGLPENVSRGGGGGAVPRSGSAGRSSNLPSVPSAPITRTIVIRGAPPPGTPVPASVPPALPQATGVIPLATPPPSPPVPEGRSTPAGPPAPAPAPRTKYPRAPNVSGHGIPDSFRAGYAEYLRSATTSDILVAALPGVAGIAGFSIVGAYAGYRRARAVQAALLPPVPTSILL